MSLSLNRWLTRNRVNKIGRTRGYFVMPSFDITYTWGNYSDIVLVFNYAASRNFSLINSERLRNLSTAFTLCIAWADGDGNVYRYRLNTGVGEVIYSTIPVYTNQLIKKNFRLEVWSTPALVAVTTADILVNTSALGSEDTRQGVDFSLGTATVVDSGFGTIITPDPTEPPQLRLVFHLDYTEGVTEVAGKVSQWADKTGNYTFAQATAGKRPVVDSGPQPYLNGVVFSGDNRLQSEQAITIGELYLLFLPGVGSSSANNAVIYGNGTDAVTAAGYTLYSFESNGTDDLECTTDFNGIFKSAPKRVLGVSPNTDALFGLLRLVFNSQGGTVQCGVYGYGAWAGVFFDSDLFNSTDNNITFTAGNLILGDSSGVANEGFILRHAIGYLNSCSSPATAIQYLAGQTGTYWFPDPPSFPFTFNAANTVPSNV